MIQCPPLGRNDMRKHARIAGISVLLLVLLSLWPALQGIAQEKALGNDAYIGLTLEFLIRAAVVYFVVYFWSSRWPKRGRS